MKVYATITEGHRKIHNEGIQYKSYNMPADLEIAKKHREAWKVAKPIALKENQQLELCPCCLRQVLKEQIGVTKDEMVLSFLGSGYPLYFNFIKCCLMIVGVLFLTSGQYQLVSNLVSGDCDDLVIQAKHQYKTTQMNEWNSIVNNYCLNDFISKSTVANKRFDKTLMQLPKYFNFTSVLFILIIIFFFRKSQLIIDNECDIRENTPQDYTIIVKDLPLLENPIKELTEYFQTNFDVEVCAVNPVYYADQLKPLQKDLQKLIDQKRDNIKDIDELLDQKEQEIKNKAIEIQSKSTNFTGTAFVSLLYEDHKHTILNKSEYLTKQVFFNIIFGCIFQESKSLKFTDDSIIKVEVAPEPADVIWENMVYTDNRRFMFRLLGFTFSQAVIALFLFILLWLAKVQAIESSKNPGQLVEVDTPDGQVEVMLPSPTTSINMPSLLAALTTTFINAFVVDQLSLFLVNFESYETYSLYSVSLASKLSLMLFFNSAIIAFLASTFYTRNIYGPGGLIYTEMYFFISNAMIPPIVNLINPDRILKWMKLKAYRFINRQLSQAELNELYEYPIHQIELRYADIMKTLFITFFYAPLIPAGYIFGFIGLGLYYYAEKISLVKYSTVRNTPSVQLSILMTEMMEYLPIIFAIGCLIFTYQIDGTISYWNIMAMLMAFTTSVFPMQSLIEWLFPVEEQDEVTTFNEAKNNFQTFYDGENPVTKYNLQIKQSSQPKKSYQQQ